MESMQYAEATVKEFLLFRGFTHTLHAFVAEVESDISHGLQVDRIVDLLFTVYIPRFEADNLINLMAFLQQSFFSSADVQYHNTVRKLEASLKKYYIVHALQKGRSDHVLHFFERYGDSLLHSGSDWDAWFAIPYIKNPGVDPRFQVYFSKEWLDTLVVSFRNFVSEVFDSIRLPVLLKIHSELLRSKTVREELEKLRIEYRQLQKTVQAKDNEILKLESECQSYRNRAEKEEQMNRISNSSNDLPSSMKAEGTTKWPFIVQSSDENISLNSDMENLEVEKKHVKNWRKEDRPLCAFPLQEGRAEDAFDSSVANHSKEDDFPQVAIKSQETFAGHTSPITRCRFSTTGTNIASASVDGTVRIWTPDAAASTSRNATIYCGAEILSIEWENKSDRLLLLGTAECGIKAWNVDAKRMVCDLNTEASFPRILELKCSPTDPLFLCAASTSNMNSGQKTVEALGFGSLTVWNTKSWKLLNVLPLGEDPPVVTSVCFNHNGKLVAAGASDGMIRLFDMNGCLPITGWPAHDGCSVSSVRFGHDHSSIFSLGGDGKVLEWSLHNQGQILQSQDGSMFCSVDNTKLPRHEMAFGKQGRRLLLTSNLASAPLFKLDHPKGGYRTLEHNGPITSVDWHPLLPMFLTGSADYSVQVTSVH